MDACDIEQNMYDRLATITAATTIQESNLYVLGFVDRRIAMLTDFQNRFKQAQLGDTVVNYNWNEFRKLIASLEETR